jgi:hypothetical protein
MYEENWDNSIEASVAIFPIDLLPSEADPSEFLKNSRFRSKRAHSFPSRNNGTDFAPRPGQDEEFTKIYR